MTSSFKLSLSPLQGYTEAIYRNAHAACFGGIDTYFSPFVRVENKQGAESPFRNKDIRDILPERNTVSHFVPQLIASNADELSLITEKFLSLGYHEADINMGCPFPMIAKKHKGSGLLPHPDEVAALLDTAANYPEMKFSLKMRLGWEDTNECLELLDMINSSCLTDIAVHARTGKQQYKGNVQMEAFEVFAQGCKKPLHFNGDVCTVNDIHRIQAAYPTLAGIYIGRGILQNPFLPLLYKEQISLQTLPVAEMVSKFHSMLFEQYNTLLQCDHHTLQKMQLFWEYLAPQLEKKSKKRIAKCKLLSEYLKLSGEVLDNISAEDFE